MALKRDPQKARDWQRRSAETAEARRRALGRPVVPPKRKTDVAPVARSAPKPRAAGLRPRSTTPKARARQASIAEACGAAIARDKGKCQARGLAPGGCWGPIDPQHVIPQGVDKTLADDVENIIACCRGHHEWLGDHPEEARELGIHGHYGDDLAELARRRVAPTR